MYFFPKNTYGVCNCFDVVSRLLLVTPHSHIGVDAITHLCIVAQKKNQHRFLAFFVLCSAGKLQRGVYSQIYFDVSSGNGRQASSKNRTQGGKPTLSESSKK